MVDYLEPSKKSPWFNISVEISVVSLMPLSAPYEYTHKSFLWSSICPSIHPTNHLFIYISVFNAVLLRGLEPETPSALGPPGRILGVLGHTPRSFTSRAVIQSSLGTVCGLMALYLHSWPPALSTPSLL